MAIEPKTRIEIFDDMQAYLQSLASNLTDYNDGSILKSILDAPAAEMEQLWNALNVAFTAAYVSTATGDDLDNKVGDFGLDRNNATYASGYVTFGRSTAFNQDFTIPSGTVVQTASTSTVPGKPARQRRWVASQRWAIFSAASCIRRSACPWA